MTYYELSGWSSFPGREIGLFLLTVSSLPVSYPIDQQKFNGLSMTPIHYLHIVSLLMKPLSNASSTPSYPGSESVQLCFCKVTAMHILLLQTARQLVAKLLDLPTEVSTLTPFETEFPASCPRRHLVRYLPPISSACAVHRLCLRVN